MFVATDELEAQLREKDRVLHGLTSEATSSSSTPFTASVPRPDITQDINVLPPFPSNGSLSSEDLSNLYNTFNAPSKSMDPNAGMDFSTFPSGSSLDNLAGVASMLGSGSITDVPMNHTPDLTLDGMGPTYTPGSRSLDLVFMSWPLNLPDPEVTRHL